jgi:hypothetical protein
MQFFYSYSKLIHPFIPDFETEKKIDNLSTIRDEKISK